MRRRAKPYRPRPSSLRKERPRRPPTAFGPSSSAPTPKVGSTDWRKEPSLKSDSIDFSGKPDTSGCAARSRQQQRRAATMRAANYDKLMAFDELPMAIGRQRDSFGKAAAGINGPYRWTIGPRKSMQTPIIKPKTKETSPRVVGPGRQALFVLRHRRVQHVGAHCARVPTQGRRAGHLRF